MLFFLVFNIFENSRSCWRKERKEEWFGNMWKNRKDV